MGWGLLFLGTQVITMVRAMVANNMKAVLRLNIQYNYYCMRLLLNCLVYLQAVKHLRSIWMLQFHLPVSVYAD